MTLIIGHHDVNDVEAWLASSTREDFFGPLGVTDIQTFVAPGTNHVGLQMWVPDMDAFNAAMQTPEAAAAMEHDGVIPETLVILLATEEG